MTTGEFAKAVALIVDDFKIVEKMPTGFLAMLHGVILEIADTVDTELRKRARNGMKIVK